MNHKLAAWAAALIFFFAPAGFAQTITLEPDDYPNGADLSNISPFVHLSTTLDDNVPVPAFFVSATDDNQDLAPTGLNVFGHANVGFWNNFRRLRMDFAVPATEVGLLFAGGTFFDVEIGRLEIFNASNALLGQYATAPLGPGVVEAMHLLRPQGDIAYAIAYIAADEGNFGRLDRLTFTLVPEPTTATLLGLGTVGALFARRIRRS